MIILGAGLSGLLAGALDRHATILERQSAVPNNHHAVLRHRDDRIGQALNIPFRRVRVLKAIWLAGKFVQPTPQTSNFYSRKVTGQIVARSILDIAPAERYIAPRDFVAQLADTCVGRVKLGTQVDGVMLRGLPRPLISTIPIFVTLEMLSGKVDLAERTRFKSAAIRVVKYRVPGADEFQTVYFPDPALQTYRTTLTGDELAIEGVHGEGPMPGPELIEVLTAFGLRPQDVEMLDSKRQPLGKILPLPKDERQALLFRLTRDHGIYSLGRFACWRQSLLDDVYEDYFKIRRMMALGEYDLAKAVL